MNVATLLKQYERIGVVGLGLTGLSCARFLLQHDITPVLFDTRQQAPQAFQSDSSLNQCETYLGELQLEELLGLDMAIVSPGVPVSLDALKMAADAGVELISDIELFGRLVDVPVIAVTGSNGKSTVVSMCGHILESCGRNPGVGGNIGIPALELLHKGYDCIVLELSSFQLELTSSLRLAAATVLNVTPDHLDRYPSETAYALAKNRIYRHADMCIYNREDKQTQPTRQRRLQHQVSFGLAASDQGFGVEEQNNESWICFTGQPLLAVKDLPVEGDYNQLNAQAALALVSALGVDIEQAALAVPKFQSLAHRCQLVVEHNGVRWINDSKATNTGAAIAAITGLRPKVPGKLILIAGGDAKGADLGVMKSALEQVDLLITLGRDGRYLAALKPGALQVNDMQQAVNAAYQAAADGSLVLLSPACASLDMFSGFAERGEVFAAAAEACYARD
ncbi:UDP-N-acetylmuramoyl-L-alanine--D-glutamate ligase [Aliidiomarina minuta]|uniref:UDP-N-acetylmuramoylalanine--D-glutamate ligase n=1 Tax=Aliidiomarina minuta TaxID=880057 RepID=A0A432W952_9GAMM|nr:UDP-N-acetylmuramoyl-L-alanine--D-glutamate ligase [Aliidiomarina minuta]RUO26622.1 UDP-N-acetylmuramoyl-L-alanine--D-glutamate ligase [Aliidiomarina minuta]